MNPRGAGVLFVFCTIAGSAGVGVYAQLQKGQYEQATLGQVAQRAPTENSADSEYAVNGYPLFSGELEPGDGKTETEAYCSLCHSARYITMQPPLPAATWEAEVNKMKQAFGATIPDPAAAKIIQYLQAHYTPETRKH